MIWLRPLQYMVRWACFWRPRGTVIAFGSCLARRVAKEYGLRYHATMISSVYHNRSDAFVARYVNKTDTIGPLAPILARLVPNQSRKNADTNAHNVVRNQFPEGIGKHRMRRGVGLFDALEKHRIDVIFIDNYVDMRGKLFVLDEALHGQRLFVRPRDFVEPAPLAAALPHLTIEESVQAFTQLIRYFRQKQPHATIVFLQFPARTRPQDDRFAMRVAAFEAAFASDEAVVFAPLAVPAHQRSKEWNHFRIGYYRALARMVRARITQQSVQ